MPNEERMTGWGFAVLYITRFHLFCSCIVSVSDKIIHPFLYVLWLEIVDRAMVSFVHVNYTVFLPMISIVSWTAGR